MADGYVQVAPDGSGKKIQTFENSVSGNTVEAQAIVLVDSTGTPITLPTIASTTNLLAGDGSGNAISSTQIDATADILLKDRVGIGANSATGLAVDPAVTFYSGPDWSTVSGDLSPTFPFEQTFITKDGAFGNAGLATAATGASPQGLVSYAVGSSTSGSVYGITVQGIGGSGSGTVYGIFCKGIGSANGAIVEGMDIDGESSGTQNITSLYGISCGAHHNSTGTLGSATGLNLGFAKGAGAGAITTAYGLNVDDVTVATTNYAIKTGAGLVYFGGTVNTQTGFTKGGTEFPIASNGFVTRTAANTYSATTAPSGTVVGTTDTQTLTNKTINPRTHSVASATSWTPDFDSYDQEEQTALAGDITAINAPTATGAVDGQKRILRIKSNASPHNISGWNPAYVPIGVTLPTSIAASKTIYAGTIYNGNTSKWDVVAVAIEA